VQAGAHTTLCVAPPLDIGDYALIVRVMLTDALEHAYHKRELLS